MKCVAGNKYNLPFKLLSSILYAMVACLHTHWLKVMGSASLAKANELAGVPNNCSFIFLNSLSIGFMIDDKEMRATLI